MSYFSLEYNKNLFRKTKTTMQKNNNQETNVYTVREHTLMHLKVYSHISDI